MTASSDLPPETIVAELSLAVGQLLRRLRAEANADALSLSQMSVLSRLEQGGAMTTAELARIEAMKPQSMAPILAGLEQEGLVGRQPHPTDGRQVLFALTAKSIEERKRRKLAKRDWLVAALGEFEPAELRTLTAAIPLIKRLGDS